MNKVLVAEDDEFIASAYRLKLEKSGFQVLIAKDGEEALRRIEDFQPDVVLLDLIMPVKDGFAVLEELQARNVTPKLPVIVASNLGQEEDKKKSIELGAIRYIVKSDISLDQVVVLLKDTLHDTK